MFARFRPIGSSSPRRQQHRRFYSKSSWRIIRESLTALCSAKIWHSIKWPPANFLCNPVAYGRQSNNSSSQIPINILRRTAISFQTNFKLISVYSRLISTLHASSVGDYMSMSSLRSSIDSSSVHYSRRLVNRLTWCHPETPCSVARDRCHSNGCLLCAWPHCTPTPSAPRIYLPGTTTTNRY